MSANTTPRFRYLGVIDDITVCEKCGKSQLRSTVVVQPLDIDGNPDGEPNYYGSTCAARVLGVNGRGAGTRVLSEAWAADWQTRNAADDAHRMLAHYGLPETGELTHDEIIIAMRRYIQAHPGIHRWVEETGIGVRARVLDMLDRKRAALAAHAALTRNSNR